jgi:hypothetical protein
VGHCTTVLVLAAGLAATRRRTLRTLALLPLLLLLLHLLRGGFRTPAADSSEASAGSSSSSSVDLALYTAELYERCAAFAAAVPAASLALDSTASDGCL